MIFAIKKEKGPLLLYLGVFEKVFKRLFVVQVHLIVPRTSVHEWDGHCCRQLCMSSLIGNGKLSLGQAAFRSLKSTHTRTCLFFLRTGTMLEMKSTWDIFFPLWKQQLLICPPLLGFIPIQFASRIQWTDRKMKYSSLSGSRSWIELVKIPPSMES